MPVDFMTKWKGKKQTDTAVAYITNSKNQITSNAEISALETNPEAVYVRRLRDTGVAVTVAKSLCAAVIAPTLRPSNDSRTLACACRTCCTGSTRRASTRGARSGPRSSSPWRRAWAWTWTRTPS